MPAGRLSDYTSELVGQICERIANGQSVREIARSEGMPAMATIFRWLAENTEFQEQYARAKEAQAEYMAEEILDISDDGTNDWMERKGPNGIPIGWQENGEAMQRSKLRVDSRKWLLSKLLPKKYGERLTTDGRLTFSADNTIAGLFRRIADEGKPIHSKEPES